MTHSFNDVVVGDLFVIIDVDIDHPVYRKGETFKVVYTVHNEFTIRSNEHGGRTSMFHIEKHEYNNGVLRMINIKLQRVTYEELFQ